MSTRTRLWLYLSPGTSPANIPSLFLFIFCFLIGFTACARKPSDFELEREAVQQLQLELNQLFSDIAFQNAFWGVAVQSMDDGELLFALNEDKLMLPASNMKIVTAAAALHHLGPDFRYETKVATDGAITGGTLQGNLLIHGAGDPTISGRFHNGDPFAVFHDWAQQLNALGIREIDGDIIGFDDYFEGKPWADGWSWENLDYNNAPEVSALQFHENVFTVVVSPKGVKTMEPDTSYFCIVNRLTDGEQKRVQWDRHGNTILVDGTIPPGEDDYGTFAVRDPASFFVHALKETLQKNGIRVSGNPYKRVAYSSNAENVLFMHKSPPLAEILGVMMGVSHNLYAETLFKTLGKRVLQEGTFEAGGKVVTEYLGSLGIASQSFAIADGSGLSRYNLISASALLQLLRSMKASPNFSQFHAALPVGGVSGTIRNRMKTTQAEGRVHAKTGALTYVRSLAGYVKTVDGETFAFVMLANNFTAPRQAAEYVQDLALQRLAAFSRKPASNSTKNTK